MIQERILNINGRLLEKKVEKSDKKKPEGRYHWNLTTYIKVFF